MYNDCRSLVYSDHICARGKKRLNTTSRCTTSDSSLSLFSFSSIAVLNYIVVYHKGGIPHLASESSRSRDRAQSLSKEKHNKNIIISWNVTVYYDTTLSFFNIIFYCCAAVSVCTKKKCRQCTVKKERKRVVGGNRKLEKTTKRKEREGKKKNLI